MLQQILGVGGRSPRAAEQAVLVQPVGHKAVQRPDEVEDRHAAGVKEHAANDVHRLGQPERDVPLGQEVQRLQRLLRDLLIEVEYLKAEQRGHDLRSDHRGDRGGERLGEDRDKQRGAHRGEPIPVSLVERALPEGKGLRDGLVDGGNLAESRIHEVDHQTCVDELRGEELRQLAPRHLGDRAQLLHVDEESEDLQEHEVQRADGADTGAEQAVHLGLLLGPVLADLLLLGFVGRRNQLRVPLQRLHAKAVLGPLVAARLGDEHALGADFLGAGALLRHPQVAGAHACVPVLYHVGVGADDLHRQAMVLRVPVRAVGVVDAPVAAPDPDEVYGVFGILRHPHAQDSLAPHELDADPVPGVIPVGVASR
mmetsp:Transcript_81712/g.236069  ORF Transcript_81712/g.236069 Transcript_81712/m.236069 type:complete len:368 (+) Transcript_81712:625-1728(+)